MQSTRELVEHVPQVGHVAWIGLRTERHGPVRSVTATTAIEGVGLDGDHRTIGRAPSATAKRQVTLVQAEHLPAVSALAGVEVGPEDTRRNLLIAGINLRALKDRRFTVGEVELEATGECHPCSLMERTIGTGGFQAMRGHGGLTARILRGGRLHVGDEVRAVGGAVTAGLRDDGGGHGA